MIMNNYPISSPSEAVKTQPLTVCVQIGQQDTPTLLSFLMAQQISFELVYQAMPSISLKSTDITTQASSSPSLLSSKREIPETVLPHLTIRQKIEWAYDFYIQKQSNQTIPAEVEIAAQLDMTPSHFRNLFKRIYGKGFYQFYLEKRMEYASKLLRKGLTCNEVAKMVGYGSNSAIKFNKMFQKHFGVTPKKYQLEHYQ